LSLRAGERQPKCPRFVPPSFGSFKAGVRGGKRYFGGGSKQGKSGGIGVSKGSVTATRI